LLAPPTHFPKGRAVIHLELVVLAVLEDVAIANPCPWHIAAPLWPIEALPSLTGFAVRARAAGAATGITATYLAAARRLTGWLFVHAVKPLLVGIPCAYLAKRSAVVLFDLVVLAELQDVVLAPPRPGNIAAAHLFHTLPIVANGVARAGAAGAATTVGSTHFPGTVGRARKALAVLANHALVAVSAQPAAPIGPARLARAIGHAREALTVVADRGVFALAASGTTPVATAGFARAVGLA
jgi:hypothetical protein